MGTHTGKIGVLIGLMLLAGCSNPINLRTAKHYFEGGRVNAQQDKWFDARMSFGRAWNNAEVGNADDRVKAVYAYEYGRSSGAICDWEQAERGLKAAAELDRKTKGPVHMSLVELGRMNNARGDYEKSAEYFESGKQELDRLQADTRDAIGYANILGEYADVLDLISRKSDAEALRKRESEIRAIFPGRTSGHDQTPYGKFCDQFPQAKKQ